MCYAELGAVIPRAGGSYQYVLRAYGRLAGFMVAWSMVVVLMPAAVAMTSITLGTYISDYVIPGDCAPPRETIQLFAILVVCTFLPCAQTHYREYHFCQYRVTFMSISRKRKPYFEGKIKGEGEPRGVWITCQSQVLISRSHFRLYNLCTVFSKWCHG